MGSEHLDSGELLRDRKCSIGYLPQEIHPLREGTVFENMLDHLGPWTEADRRLKDGHDRAWRTATRRRSTTTTTRWRRSSPPAATRWRRAPRRSCWAWGSRSRSSTRPVATLSGGWAMRLALGGLLAFEHDLLLLDEPTNHLDLLSVKWFEEFLRSYPGAILITCHDRDFLDRVITKTFELELGKLHAYPGNYSAYLPQKEHRLAVHQASFDAQQKKIRQMQDFVDRNRANAATAARAQSRLKAIEKIERIDAPADRQLHRCGSSSPSRRGAARSSPSSTTSASPTARRSSTAGSTWRSSAATRSSSSGPTAPARRP